MLFSFLRGGRDEDRADAIIRYLNDIFDVRESFITHLPRHTQLQLFMALVDVKITCGDNKISFTFRGYSNNNLEYHVPAEVERVKAEVRSYLGGSHAAKWRHRVTGL